MSNCESLGFQPIHSVHPRSVNQSSGAKTCAALAPNQNGPNAGQNTASPSVRTHEGNAFQQHESSEPSQMGSTHCSGKAKTSKGSMPLSRMPHTPIRIELHGPEDIAAMGNIETQGAKRSITQDRYNQAKGFAA